jgi:hypothetical protein
MLAFNRGSTDCLLGGVMSKGSKPGLTEYALTIGLVGIFAAMLLHPASWRLAAIMGPIDKILKQAGIADLTLAGTPQPANHTGPKWAESSDPKLAAQIQYGDSAFAAQPGKPPLEEPKKTPRPHGSNNLGSSRPSPAEEQNFILEQEEKAYSAAVQNAKEGGIKYLVPPMTVGEKATVIVRVYGSRSQPEQQKDFPATGSGTLKVIPTMLVTLSATDNPDSFSITENPPETGNQFVPEDNFAEWAWTVKPLKGGEEPKKMRITAFMVFNAKLPNGQPMQTQINSYTATVIVRLQPRMEALSEWLSENWTTVLKYLVPSGGGATLLVWWITRNREKNQPAKEEGKPAEEKERPEKEAEDDDDEDKEGSESD